MVKKAFKKVILTSKFCNEEVTNIALQCIEVLTNIGIQVAVTNELKKVDKKLYVDKSKVIKTADLVISIGGDGTMLDSAKNYGFHSVPILGINLGNLGFLTDIQPENINNSLIDIISGKYIIDKRIFLEAKINQRKKKFIALNEVIIHSGSIAKLTEYEVYINQTYVYKQRADGLIVSTPTGSTAYSLSGGGPIVHPSVNAFTILPMLSHSISTSPLLVKDSSKVSINILSERINSELCLDSHNKLPLKKGDTVHIKKSKNILHLIHPKDHNFYAGCRSKLGWSAGIINN